MSLCHIVDVKKLMIKAYMNKNFAKARPMPHRKIGIKNHARLMRLAFPLRT